MSTTVAYYNEQAPQFFAATVNVDMTPLYEPFVAHLPAGARVLDAGCGSGRDVCAFAARGYKVDAFDASAALAQMASDLSKLPVEVLTFDQYQRPPLYDGIWACASLLHLPVAEIPQALARLWHSLKPRGVCYLSFKHGVGERQVEGRHFTDVNEEQVRRWVEHLPRVAGVTVWVTPDQRPGRAEDWLNVLLVKDGDDGNRLVTGGLEDPFLPHLTRSIAHATDVDISVSFVKATGLRLLLPELHNALARDQCEGKKPARVRFLFSDYLDVSDPDACRLLMLLQDAGAEVRVHCAGSSGSFHLKAYIFSVFEDGRCVSGQAYIGSSNISRQALSQGLEWNYRVSFPGDRGFLEARAGFERLFGADPTAPLTHAWIDAYERRRVPLARAVAPGSLESEPPPEPSLVQRQVLDALRETREEGYQRGLVVLATGLGKTWLAAFDTHEMGARRVLFVAHREEILLQAAQTFVRIRPGDQISLYRNSAEDLSAHVLCASVQTLSRTSHLERFTRKHFDYMVVDEFHHASAPTYRKLLQHFDPRFLLGLTATPDRTDQSDILSLCDDNMVFTYNLFEGIQAKLLVPFHYYGIFDESVNYAEVPWRNGRFDPDSLSNKLATLGRARHALKEWKSRAQTKTLAFCISVKHADFMANQFVSAGVRAAAVHGESEISRSEGLAQLESGALQVLFSVDLFSEGMDLPAIDTVLMLRPTESKILFLQQLGRGLRRADTKSHLVVLDFIGNHHSFFHKPQALCHAGLSHRALADFARKAEAGKLSLPAGCYANFDLQLIEFLKRLDDRGIDREFMALRDTLGRRPTLLEFYRSGAPMTAMKQQYQSWFEMLDALGELSPIEREVVEQQRPLLRECQFTAMTRSYKMVLLEAFQELEGWQNGCDLAKLASRSWLVIRRRRSLIHDLPPDMSASEAEPAQWLSYWRKHPIAAWLGENFSESRMPLFVLRGLHLTYREPIPDRLLETLAASVQELIDFRLASYEVRRGNSNPASKVIQFPSRERSGTVLPFFPNLRIACGHFKSGRADSEEYRNVPDGFGDLNPQHHFIARASGNSMNGGKNPIHDGDYLLLEHISPTRAGSITGAVMAIERQDQSGDDQYLLRVVHKGAAGGYVLHATNPDYADMPATEDMRTLARLKAVLNPLDMAIGLDFMREDIPPLFNEVFNLGNWQAGHVVLKPVKAHVLLVTLNKQGQAEEHRYVDHWIDEHTFYWQSQNATTPESSKGLALINHVKEEWSVHLFVRDHKMAAGKAAPFRYVGPVQYLSHEGSGPMGVLFRVL